MAIPPGGERCQLNFRVDVPETVCAAGSNDTSSV